MSAKSLTRSLVALAKRLEASMYQQTLTGDSVTRQPELTLRVGSWYQPITLLDQFIEASSMLDWIITQLGARVMQGLKGDVSIPKLATSVTNSAFVAEGSAPSEGAAVFAQTTMTPRTLAAYVDVSSEANASVRSVC